MKTHYLAIMLAMGVLLGSPMHAQESGGNEQSRNEQKTYARVEWKATFADALAAAKSQGKPVFLFTTY